MKASLRCMIIFSLYLAYVHHGSSKIIDLSRDKQQEMFQAARLRCFKTMFQKKYPETGLYCNRTWDSIACWSDVPAGTIAIQSCPDYVNRFDTEAYATRKCLEDGTWYIGHTNRSWTNYTACQSNATVKSDKYKIIAEHMPKIRVMLNVGYSVSLICLIGSVIIMVYLKKLHCSRNCVHINLFISFILRACVSLVREHLLVGGMGFPNDVYQEEDGVWELIPNRSNWECKLFFTIFHYCLGANYMWIFMEGLYLHMLIFVSVFSEKSSVIMYMVAGWLMPLVWVVPWAIVRALVLDVYCWNTLEDKHYNWIMRAPITVTILVNFFFFVNIIRVLFTKLKSQNTREARKYRYRKLAKSTLVLIPLFGVHYIIFLGFPDDSDSVQAELVRMYFEMFFNSFQGFMVSMMFCFLNGEVQAEILKKWNRYKLRRFGGQKSQKSATSMSTYLSKARNSLHSIHSLVNDRKDSMQKTGDSPPNRNRKRSSISSVSKQSNGYAYSSKGGDTLLEGSESPYLNGTGTIIHDAIVEEESTPAHILEGEVVVEVTRRKDNVNENEIGDAEETSAMLHTGSCDNNQNREKEICLSQSNDSDNSVFKHNSEDEDSGNCFLLSEIGDYESAKRLLTDEEILSENLV